MKLLDYIEDSALGRPRYLHITDKLKIHWPFPIVAMLHSSAGAKTRWTVPVYRVFSAISNAKYAVKYRLFPTRYRIKTGLPPGYHDPRSLLLPACMAVLGRYIDEMGVLDAIADFNAELRGELEHSQADNQEAAAEIWRWWTVTLPADKARREDMIHRLFGDRDGEKMFEPDPDNPKILIFVPPKWNDEEKEMEKDLRALEKKISEDKRQMLHRLVDIRESLWT